MKKRWFTFVLIAAVFCTGLFPFAAKAANIAYATTYTILVDGKPVAFDAYALKDANGNDTNYLKLRDVAYILNGTAAQFNVDWKGFIDISTKTAYTTKNGSEMSTPFSGNQSYQFSSSAVKVNGASVGMDAILLKDAQSNGYTYFKLRDLGAALGFGVDWDQSAMSIVITTKMPLVTDAYSALAEWKYGSGTPNRTVYHLPRVNLNTSAVSTMNTQILQTHKKEIQSCLSDIQTYGEPGYGYYGYAWFTSGSVLSLLIRRDAYQWNSVEYDCYNVDTAAGTLLSAQALVQRYGWTWQQYTTRAKEVFKQRFQKNYGVHSQQAAYTTQLNKTIADANITAAKPYLNQNGKLCVIYREYSLVGAEYYWWTINLETGLPDLPPAFAGLAYG